MRFVHTFYSGPLVNNKFTNFDVALQYTIIDYACSAAYIKHNGYKIILVTDKLGYEILNFIPYDEIIVLNFDFEQSIHFAAQFKIEALKRIRLDDVLIDGDLFIRKKEAFDLLEQYKEDVIVSFYEPLSYTLSSPERKDYYNDLFYIFQQIKFDYPYHIPKMTDLEWPNTSMLKFNSQELKDDYIKQYEHHVELLKNYDFKDRWPDIIIEQYFLRLLVNYKNASMKVFIDGFPEEESNIKAISLGFTHLGSAKTTANKLILKWLYDINEELYKITLNEIAKYIEMK